MSFVRPRIKSRDALVPVASVARFASKPAKVPVTARVAKVLSTDNPLERQAVVDVNGISVVLTARRRPFHEIKDFTILGLDPTRFKIVVVKAGYLVPEIAAIANPNLMALTGGAVNQDIEHLESKHRVPSWPFQPDLQWKPSIVVSARSALK